MIACPQARIGNQHFVTADLFKLRGRSAISEQAVSGGGQSGPASDHPVYGVRAFVTDQGKRDRLVPGDRRASRVWVIGRFGGGKSQLLYPVADRGVEHGDRPQAFGSGIAEHPNSAAQRQHDRFAQQLFGLDVTDRRADDFCDLSQNVSPSSHKRTDVGIAATSR